MVSLLDGFLQLQFLCLFLFVALLAAPLQLLGCELQVEQMLLHAGHRHPGEESYLSLQRFRFTISFYEEICLLCYDSTTESVYRLG